MPTLLTSGSAKATSADFTLTEPTMVFLLAPGGGPLTPATKAVFRVKAGTAYGNAAEMNSIRSSGVLPAGTYQVTRLAGTFSVERP